MRVRTVAGLALMLGIATALSASSFMSKNAASLPVPPHVAMRPSATAPDLQTVLDQQAALDSKPIETLTR